MVRKLKPIGVNARANVSVVSVTHEKSFLDLSPKDSGLGLQIPNKLRRCVLSLCEANNWN